MPVRACDIYTKAIMTSKKVRQAQATRYKLLYNITREEYDKILRLQRGRCAICQKPPKTKRLAVDHCHKSGLIRGLLCWRCNNAIGKFGDDQTLIWSAFLYLFSSPATVALGEKRYGVIGRVSRKAKNREYGGPELEAKKRKIDPLRLVEYIEKWWGAESNKEELYTSQRGAYAAKEKTKKLRRK